MPRPYNAEDGLLLAQAYARQKRSFEFWWRLISCRCLFEAYAPGDLTLSHAVYLFLAQQAFLRLLLYGWKLSTTLCGTTSAPSSSVPLRQHQFLQYTLDLVVEVSGLRWHAFKRNRYMAYSEYFFRNWRIIIHNKLFASWQRPHSVRVTTESKLGHLGYRNKLIDIRNRYYATKYIERMQCILNHRFRLGLMVDRNLEEALYPTRYRQNHRTALRRGLRVRHMKNEFPSQGRTPLKLEFLVHGSWSWGASTLLNGPNLSRLYRPCFRLVRGPHLYLDEPEPYDGEHELQLPPPPGEVLPGHAVLPYSYIWGAHVQPDLHPWGVLTQVQYTATSTEAVR